MAAFAVSGTTTPLGSRVVASLGAQAAVVAVPPDGPDGLDGVGCLVWLAIGPGPLPGPGGQESRLAGLRRALAAAERAGVARLVHLSSAVVYGAAPDNDVPLTEDAPVRPDRGFAWAVELAEAERLVAEWRDGAPDRAAAVLRPALVVAPGDGGTVAPALGGLFQVGGGSRPVQYVHVDDVASAVVTCATATPPVDGVFNVAPDGWIADAEAAALAGTLLPAAAVPAGLARPARSLLRALSLAATGPDAEPSAIQPWVVASDRLRALGWKPTQTTEEAIVATTTGSPLAQLPGARRQELLLATAAAVTAMVATLAAVLVRALRRR